MCSDTVANCTYSERTVHISTVSPSGPLPNTVIMKDIQSCHASLIHFSLNTASCKALSYNSRTCLYQSHKIRTLNIFLSVCFISITTDWILLNSILVGVNTKSCKMNYILFHIKIIRDSSLGYRMNNQEIRIPFSTGANMFLFFSVHAGYETPQPLVHWLVGTLSSGLK